MLGISGSTAKDSGHVAETVIAAVTGLMSRAHSLPEAGEVVFVDASGSMDHRGLRVFLLMTWSGAWRHHAMSHR